MYGYIYLTTNKVNGKKYIGQHKGGFDPNYIGSGTILWDAIRKYGRENFYPTSLMVCKTKEELNDMEIFFINTFNAVESEDFYNVVNGGLGGILYERRDGEYNPFFGKTQTEKQKKLTSQALKGKKRPPEVIAKWSATQKGKKLSDEHKAKLTKKVKIHDLSTNEILEFDSNSAAMLYCNCSNPQFYLCKRTGKTLKGRFIILKEDKNE